VNLYRINNWSALFENNRSRQCDKLSWVPVPNSHDGENYSMLMDQPNAAELYTAWILMLQVASKCNPRGTLTRGNGQPHDARSLAVKTRARAEWFTAALNYLTSNTDWLTVEQVAGGRQATDVQVTSGTSGERQAGDEERKKEGIEGIEGIGQKAARIAAPRFTIEQVNLEANRCGLPESEAEKLWNYYSANGWKVGRNPVKSLPHLVAGWTARWRERANDNNSTKPNPRNAGVARCGPDYGAVAAKIAASNDAIIQNPNLDF
jgi:hypothetical protein